jgi:hypothetical protein
MPRGYLGKGPLPRRLEPGDVGYDWDQYHEDRRASRDPVAEAKAFLLSQAVKGAEKAKKSQEVASRQALLSPDQQERDRQALIRADLENVGPSVFDTPFVSRLARVGTRLRQPVPRMIEGAVELSGVPSAYRLVTGQGGGSDVAMLGAQAVIPGFRAAKHMLKGLKTASGAAKAAVPLTIRQVLGGGGWPGKASVPARARGVSQATGAYRGTPPAVETGRALSGEELERMRLGRMLRELSRGPVRTNRVEPGNPLADLTDLINREYPMPASSPISSLRYLGGRAEPVAGFTTIPPPVANLPQVTGRLSELPGGWKTLLQQAGKGPAELSEQARAVQALKEAARLQLPESWKPFAKTPPRPTKRVRKSRARPVTPPEA